LPCAPRGRTWWPIDAEARLRALATGPADLATMDPPGRAAARELLGSLVEPLASHGRRVALAGFSQGGMLAMDYTLHADAPPSALALLSSSPIAIVDWLPRAPRLAGLPVLVTHGRSDPELAIAAGEHLAAFALAAGAAVTWLAFDGGHELPLQVWRALRSQLRALV
jgi:phospholipase/carboxylesterase